MKCSVNVDKGFVQKHIRLTTLVIQRKAISLFNELKSNSVRYDDVADFSFTVSGNEYHQEYSHLRKKK